MWSSRTQAILPRPEEPRSTMPDGRDSHSTTTQKAHPLNGPVRKDASAGVMLFVSAWSIPRLFLLLQIFVHTPPKYIPSPAKIMRVKSARGRSRPLFTDTPGRRLPQGYGRDAPQGRHTNGSTQAGQTHGKQIPPFPQNMFHSALSAVFLLPRERAFPRFPAGKPPGQEKGKFP